MFNIGDLVRVIAYPEDEPAMIGKTGVVVNSYPHQDFIRVQLDDPSGLALVAPDYPWLFMPNELAHDIQVEVN